MDTDGSKDANVASRAARSLWPIDLSSVPWPAFAAAAWTSFAVTSGVLYLVSYWSFFGINVFEFVSVADIVVASIVPLVAGLVGFAFMLTLAGLSLALSDSFPESGKKDKPKSTEPRTMSRRAIMLRLWMAGLIVLIAQGAMLVFQGSWHDLAYEVAVLMALSCAYGITRTGVLAGVVRNPLLRFAIAAIGFAIPFLSYAHGSAQAYSVRFGNRTYMYACEADLVKEAKADITGSTELRFIGKAGDYLFFERPFSHIRIVKFEDFKLFRIRKRFVTSGVELPKKPCTSEDE